MDNQPKRLEDITEADVKQAAIQYAHQFGWTIEERDCRVISVPPQQVYQEGMGAIYVPTPVWQWQVHITPRVPPNRFTAPLRVPVEYLSGAVAATDFIGPEHPRMQ